VKPLPIRIRLTGWYLAVISITSVLSSVILYLGLHSAIRLIIDRELNGRVEIVQGFLGPDHHATQSKDTYPGREHFEVNSATYIK
jgi:hypothetical protein